MSLTRNASDPGAPVRLSRWWRGYQRGQVARFDTATARALVDRGIAASYRPSREEREADEQRAAARRAAQEEIHASHVAALAMRQAMMPVVEK